MRHHKREGHPELVAVIIQLHHFLNLLEPAHILIAEPVGKKHLIGRHAAINQTVIPAFFMHLRSLEHL